MRGLLAALPFVFPVFVGSVEYDPPRITPEMKAVTEAIAQALEGLTPEGFAQKSPVERYTEVNLYEKINGRSELFHAYDVTGMTFVTFSKADDPAKFIDVFLYDMTTPLGAFGIYSVERSSGSEAIATGDGGHRTKADLFFRKGQYYASILTSGPDEEVQKAASALADTLAKRLKGKAAEIWGLAMLPAKNRVEDTVRYLMVDALGLDFLTNAFTAQYRDGEAKFTAFVARCKSADNAAEVLAKYKVHLEEFGDMAEPAKIEGASVMFADVGGDSLRRRLPGRRRHRRRHGGQGPRRGRQGHDLPAQRTDDPEMTWRGVCYANRSRGWPFPADRGQPPAPPASSTDRSPASTPHIGPAKGAFSAAVLAQRHGLVCLGHDHAGGGVRRAPPRSPDIRRGGWAGR